MLIVVLPVTIGVAEGQFKWKVVFFAIRIPIHAGCIKSGSALQQLKN